MKSILKILAVACITAVLTISVSSCSNDDKSSSDSSSSSSSSFEGYAKDLGLSTDTTNLDEKIIGTWQMTKQDTSGKKSVGSYRFDKDGVYFLIVDGEAVSYGPYSTSEGIITISNPENTSLMQKAEYKIDGEALSLDTGDEVMKLKKQNNNIDVKSFVDKTIEANNTTTTTTAK